MKILQVTPYFPPAWAYGGPPRVIFELSRELVHRGHSVTVLTTDAMDSGRRARPLRETLEGIEVFRLRNLSNVLAWHQAFLPIGVTSFLRKRLRDFDVTQLHTLRTAQNLVVHRYAKRYGIPYVLSAHGSVRRIVRQRTLKAIYDQIGGKRLLRDARRLVAQSNVERREYESAGVPASKVAVISNGIDASIYENLPLRGTFSKPHGLDGKRLVTYLGRLSPGKGLDSLLAAFGDLVRLQDDCILVVAGPDDGYRSRLIRLAERLAISDRVRFVGYVETPEKLQLLVDSDVIVYPAAHESFGLVPIEALLCGTPVVVTSGSGCGELIERAHAGITFPFGNVPSLRDALLAGLGDDHATREMVRRGRGFIREQLNWGRIATHMEEVYKGAMSEAS
ncbi:MAG TPA: glycosyltransferase [Thermoplasmata archaeon]